MANRDASAVDGCRDITVRRNVGVGPMKFTYSSGQRPLDGYTIKRGIGRGGFGEVYFAVSDGGKEVALKLVRGDQRRRAARRRPVPEPQAPQPRALYDLRTDARRRPLGRHGVRRRRAAARRLNRHPQGPAARTGQQWFRGLARAVGYLHDHGIVHRDLKPANVFLENGIVKVGDYGLCKSISRSQRTAQTQSVGTVHYMAPEISTGNYDKQIDIYAAGIMLYEMLTGQRAVRRRERRRNPDEAPDRAAGPEQGCRPSSCRSWQGAGEEPGSRFATHGRDGSGTSRR